MELKKTVTQLVNKIETTNVPWEELSKQNIENSVRFLSEILVKIDDEGQGLDIRPSDYDVIWDHREYLVSEFLSE